MGPPRYTHALHTMRDHQDLRGAVHCWGVDDAAPGDAATGTAVGPPRNTRGSPPEAACGVGAWTAPLCGVPLGGGVWLPAAAAGSSVSSISVEGGVVARVPTACDGPS